MLSNNELGLKALFDRYGNAAEKYLTVDACVSMIVEDAALSVTAD